jgi:hypothetical protein
MALLVALVLGYLVARRCMPNATFYAVLASNCKILAILFIVISLIGNISFHVQAVDVLVFPLCFVFGLIASRFDEESEDDVPYATPIYAPLGSRAPPVSEHCC